MKMSDIIEKFIKDLLSDEDYVEIQRNDLAEQYNCVPSQINYVISTRFRPSQGYYVESRRGGRRTYHNKKSWFNKKWILNAHYRKYVK